MGVYLFFFQKGVYCLAFCVILLLFWKKGTAEKITCFAFFVEEDIHIGILMWCRKQIFSLDKRKSLKLSVIAEDQVIFIK